MEFNRDNDGGCDLAEVLFDKDDSSDIVLVNGKGREATFRQIYATVAGGKVYCILAPVEDVEGIAEDEAFVFELGEGQTLTVVRDAEMSGAVFSEYYRAIAEGGK